MNDFFLLSVALIFFSSFIQNWEYRRLSSRVTEELHWSISLACSAGLASSLCGLFLISIQLREVRPGMLLLFLIVSGLSHFRILYQFRGSFNGGSDAMTSWCYLCLIAGLFFSLFLENPFWLNVSLLCIGAQSLMSYFVAGIVKAKTRAWWTGEVLEKLLKSNHYPTPNSLRAFTANRLLLSFLSVGIILFELLAPWALLNSERAPIYLALAFLFHLSNWFAFGLNRFVWAWLATYPSLIFMSSWGS